MDILRLTFTHHVDQLDALKITWALSADLSIIDQLRRQGFQADQDLTFITDDGEEVRALAERISPCSEHVLDWFHITMRITVLRQFAQGLVHHTKDAGTAALDELRRIKWFL